MMVMRMVAVTKKRQRGVWVGSNVRAISGKKEKKEKKEKEEKNWVWAHISETWVFEREETSFTTWFFWARAQKKRASPSSLLT
jgi:hypothetical protein